MQATEAMAAAAESRSSWVARMPTGSGKAAALLSVAGERAVNHGERTIISTESLSLQAQILTKDAPDMIAGIVSLGGRELQVAVLKGTNNYVDPRKTFGIAHLLADSEELNPRRLAALVLGSRPSAELIRDLDEPDPAALKRLVAWALLQYDDDSLPGDRHSYDGAHTTWEWSLVSATSADASGPNDSPYLPKAVAAKERAAAADIVIVNHTLLGIQAANALPIVVGNASLGVFDHLLIDEAHALPGEVRKQGAAEVSGRTVMSLARAVQKLSPNDFTVRRWAGEADVLADELERELRAQLGREDTLRMKKGDDPLASLGDTIKEWAKSGSKHADVAAQTNDLVASIDARKAKTRADELAAAVGSVAAHHSGEARWIQKAEQADPRFRAWTSAQSSPVDASGKLQRNLYVRPDEGSDVEGATVPLTVILVSATLPTGFCPQVGVRAQPLSFPTPFATAYAESLLFIPKAVTPAELDAVSDEGVGGKRKFSATKHRVWAAGHIIELVRANEGSALILSANGENGRHYAEQLRRNVPGHTVLSQWGEETPAQVLARWKADESSVLVGTKSFMTGVDARGETNTAVIADRPARAARNPIDDARVEFLMEVFHYDKWTADRYVYVADAAALLEQEIGRLIRAAGDRGIAAVLDPRLLQLAGGKHGPLTYPALTRDAYMKPLYEFPNRTADPAVAHEWVRRRRAALVAA
ncbi:ATP-dependent DNA helicase [Rathayibacter rathayi]|uniref:ATP-dependent DNA helicase n=1 Tax=Rathayibacter rathayi TaxID=33887 RepID=UPI0015E42F6F|nr:helicase C-terminal domain-containing protein [Rathayibacter rathayi]